VWKDVCQIRRPSEVVDGFRPFGVFAHDGGPTCYSSFRIFATSFLVRTVCDCR
jgi:hypothetical protein